MMRNTDTALVVVALIGWVTVVSGQSGNPMQQRVQRIKEATVRVLVNGNPAGTGFAVANDLIATNFHVVQQLTPSQNGQTQVTYAPTIEVELGNGRRLSAAPHASVSGDDLQNAIGRDVELLTVSDAELQPLAIGAFAEVQEGDAIYLAGYPLGVEQVIVSTGMLSTKWTAHGYLGQGGDRDVAWLDITMNKGNSGGPVLLMRDDPTDDVVVGIANFSLNPFAQSAEEFARVATEFPGNMMLMGVDFKRFATVIGSALASQSHGVGGCIAIDYLSLP